MALHPQQTPSPVAGDDRNLIVVDENYLAPTFEDRVRIFWERHGRAVITVIALLAVFFAAKFLFERYAEYRENEVRAAYAEAGEDFVALRAFAEANPSAALAGVAWVRLADSAYLAGDYAAAAKDYSLSFPLLKADPIGSRARMGQAVSLLKAGDVAAASSTLDGLANDTLFPATLRAEAAYHLAVILKDAGQTEEAARMFALAISVDTSGLWAQRASRLVERMPVAATPTTVGDAAATAGDETSAVTFPAITK
jgi:tetratricopeptide (TPR) repeat protein